MKGRFYFYERWVSQEALEAHANGEHFVRIFSAIRPLLEREMELNFIEPVTGRYLRAPLAIQTFSRLEPKGAGSALVDHAAIAADEI